MAGIKIKRNDTVEVIAGKDKGKRGRVLRVIAEKNRLLVEHVMMVKKHVKPNPQRNIKGGIAEQESTDPHLERHAGRRRGQQDPRRHPLRRRQEGSFLEGKRQHDRGEEEVSQSRAAVLIL